MSIFSKGKKKSSNDSGSVGALLDAAIGIGYITELSIIPELENVFTRATDHFMRVFPQVDIRYLETSVYHSCQYFFAKGVESAILWGASPDGKISIGFEPSDMAEDVLQTDLPPHLHKLAADNRDKGKVLFKAHQTWVMQEQSAGRQFDMESEIRGTLMSTARIGYNYALSKGYQDLR